MGTATSRRAALGIAAAALGIAAALLLAGCGGHGSAARATTTTSSSPPPAAPAFAWLRMAPPPAGWKTARISSGAAISYPPGWTRVKGDPGTTTVALFGRRHEFVGYLNLTPRQGDETLTNWARFRIEHNGEEGDRNVRTLAQAIRRHLQGATASCVEDAYTTVSGASYVEIACLFAGRRTSVVAVGASPPDDWPRIGPTVEQAITTVTA